MPLSPEGLDYEGLFPGRKRRVRETYAEDDGWSKQGKFKSFNNEDFTPPPGGEKTTIDPDFVAQNESWLRRRSHFVSFVLLFIFSIILYVRPYEFFPGLSSFTSMAFYTGVAMLAVFAFSQLSAEGNLTARPREINLVLLIGLAALLSMPMAISWGDAWKTFSELLIKTIVVFIVFVNVVRTERRLKLLLLLVLAVSIYLSVNAINDYRLGVFQVGDIATHDARIAGRIKGLFENSNDLALHLVTMIPIAVGLGFSKRDPFRKLIYLGIAGVMTAAVIVTFSRGGFIGLVAVVLLMVRRFGRKNKSLTTAALVFAVIMFLAMAPGAYSGRLSTIFSSSSDLTGSSSQRTEVLKQSVRVALRYPLFGVGIGCFPHKSPRNLVTHNAYTQVASEMGIAAMVVYIMFLVHPLRRLRLIENESYEHSDRSKFYYLSVGLQASLVGFMVSSFFGAVAYHWYVYYLVGYAVCLHRLYIIQFPPKDVLAREFWEHPFAKKKDKELVRAQPEAVL